MEILEKIKSWASSLAEAGVSLIGLGIVLEILFIMSDLFNVTPFL